MTTTPFRWPGAKNKLLPVIMDHLNPLLRGRNTDTVFCEPFVGGGAVMLEVAQQYPTIPIWLNDKDEYVASFWEVISDPNEEGTRELLHRLTEQPTIALFYALREEIPISLVEKAYHSLFFNRTTFSGIYNSGPIGGKTQNSKYKIDCRYNFIKLREKILRCRQLLVGRTKVSNSDISDLQFKEQTHVIYLDPPYVKAGPELYNEFMSLAQHQQMADKLKLLTCNWVLSYDDSPIIHQLYEFASITRIDANYCINGAKLNWVKKSELLIKPIVKSPSVYNRQFTETIFLADKTTK